MRAADISLSIKIAKGDLLTIYPVGSEDRKVNPCEVVTLSFAIKLGFDGLFFPNALLVLGSNIDMAVISLLSQSGLTEANATNDQDENDFEKIHFAIRSLWFSTSGCPVFTLFNTSPVPV